MYIRPTDIIPRLEIDGEPLKAVKKAAYLGDSFNDVGTNKHLIEDRTKKAQACIVSSMSLCNEVTLGLFTIQTLLLTYKSLFLHVVLHNSQSWCNISKKDMNSLKVKQMKYLKRVFHAPSSTPNAATSQTSVSSERLCKICADNENAEKLFEPCRYLSRTSQR